MITDRDGRIVYANRAYADLIGAETSAMCGRSSASSPATRRGGEAIYRLAQAVREGRPVEEEIRLPAPPAQAPARTAPRWYRIRGAADAARGTATGR